MAEEHSFVVNGTQRVVTCAGATPLLWVLRDRLGLTGTRYGCGAGSCGACTVWIDGAPAHACDTPVWSVVDKVVTTVEGLTDAGPHDVQQALIQHQAGQCGFCLSGIVMRGAALVDAARRTDQELTDKDVREGLEGHLCRCGAHNRIVAAIVDAGRH